MKILVTGSHGFVGTNLIEGLSGEHEIIRWDARKNEMFPACDAVIHLAGKAHDVRCKKGDGRAYFQVNTEMTKRIYDRFLESSAKKFIYFSSIKAETAETPYGLSKRRAETYILSHTDSVDQRTYVLRPCMIHGVGVKGNLPLLFKVVKKGLPWPLAAFENRRSYASMENVAFVVSELLMKDVDSGIYNICDDETISTNELIRLMNECLGRRSRMFRIPKGLVRLGAKLGDVFHLPLNSERLEKLTGYSIVDNSDIKKALGIKRMPQSALDGLKLTVKEMIKGGT